MHLTLEKNKVMNITSIVDENDFLIKMILDSAVSFNGVDLSETKSAIDVGTGGGFPGLVLAILYPSIQFTLLDSTKKKCDHVKEVALSLGLKNVNVVHARAEEFALSHREYFDIATARAVSYLNLLLELCVPLIKVGGTFVALKGKIAQGELNDSDNATKKLNCKMLNTFNYQLIDESGERTNFHFIKMKETNNKYPRSYSDMKKKPL